MKEKEEQIKEKDKVINFKISEIEIIRKKARIWKFYAKGRENEIKTIKQTNEEKVHRFQTLMMMKEKLITDVWNELTKNEESYQHKYYSLYLIGDPEDSGWTPGIRGTELFY